MESMIHPTNEFPAMSQKPPSTELPVITAAYHSGSEERRPHEHIHHFEEVPSILRRGGYFKTAFVAGQTRALYTMLYCVKCGETKEIAIEGLLG